MSAPNIWMTLEQVGGVLSLPEREGCFAHALLPCSRGPGQNSHEGLCICLCIEPCPDVCSVWQRQVACKYSPGSKSCSAKPFGSLSSDALQSFLPPCTVLG